jgi:hypothetical protein
LRSFVAAVAIVLAAVGIGIAAVALSSDGGPVVVWLDDVTNRDPTPVTADIAPVGGAGPSRREG